MAPRLFPSRIGDSTASTFPNVNFGVVKLSECQATLRMHVVTSGRKNAGFDVST